MHDVQLDTIKTHMLTEQMLLINRSLPKWEINFQRAHAQMSCIFIIWEKNVLIMLTLTEMPNRKFGCN